VLARDVVERHVDGRQCLGRDEVGNAERRQMVVDGRGRVEFDAGERVADLFVDRPRERPLRGPSKNSRMAELLAPAGAKPRSPSTVSTTTRTKSRLWSVRTPPWNGRDCGGSIGDDRASALMSAISIVAGFPVLRHEWSSLPSPEPLPATRIYIWGGWKWVRMESKPVSTSSDLKDVAAAVLTPFDDDGEILHDGIARNARFLSDRGIDLVLAGANVSEFHSLTDQEIVDVAETVVEQVGDETTVLAGTGGSLRSAIDIGESHARSGADLLMVMPPDNPFIHEQGLVEYYDSLATATDLPLVPYIRGLEPTAETIATVADLPHVAGMKYAVDDIEKFARAVSMADEDAVWLCGMGESPVPAYWAEGAEGFTSGVGNFRPIVGLELLEALRDGDWGRAARIRNATLEFSRLRDETGQHNCFPAANSIPVLKECLRLAGARGGQVRGPLVELSPADRERVHEAYDTLDEFVENAL